MIPIDHARRLTSLCKDKCKLDERTRINHTTYEVARDIIEPIAVFLVEKSLNTESDTADPFTKMDWLYSTPERYHDVSCRTMVVIVRMICLISCCIALAMINAGIGGAVLMAVLAVVDLMMAMGYCLRKPRVLAACYVLNSLSVPTLGLLGILKMIYKSSYVGGALLISTACVYVGLHFYLHR